MSTAGVDVLRWVLAGEGLIVFLSSIFIPRLFKPPRRIRSLQLLRLSLTAAAFSTATSVGVNALLSPPATPGLFVGLALMTPATCGAVAAVVIAVRGHGDIPPLT